MALTPPLTLDADPLDRWAKKSSLRTGATGWTADALQGKNMLPPATPMQSVADGLRAGATPAPAPTVTPPAPKYTPPPVNPTTGGYVNGQAQIQAGEIRGAAQMGPSPAGGGLAGPGGVAQPNKVTGFRGAVQPARDGLRSTSQFLTGAGESAGSVGGAFKSVGGGLASGLRAAAPFAKVLGAPIAAADAINDSLRTPTEQYRERFGLETPDPSLAGDLGVRALGVASDLGNSLTGGLAGKYLYRDKEPDSNTALTAVNAAPPAIKTVAGDAASTANPATAALSAMDADMPGQDPNRITLRGRAGTDVAGAPGVQKFVENGKTLYSNVAGDNKDMMDKKLVGIVPGMSKEAIDQTLRNPDGTKWSANDTATMAANLRDGVDQYRGTSRAPAAAPDTSVQMSPQRARLEALGAKGMSRTQAATLQALRSSDQQLEASNNQNASAIKREQMQNDTLRDNNAATNRSTMAGHQLDYDAKMAPIKQAAKLREMNASIFKAAGGDNARAAAMAQAAGLPAKDFQDALAAQNTSETHDQTVGTKARENAMKEFQVIGADGKPDLGASQQAYDAVRQIFPKIGSTNEADREAAMPDAKAMANIFNKARTQDKVGWDAMKFWEAKRPVLNGMPDVSGTGAANVEQVGPLAGVFTLNASNGHTVLTQKDGRKLNFGILDSRERKLLDDAQKKGWGN